MKDATTAISYTDAICNLYGCKAKTDKSGCEDIPPSTSNPTCADHIGPFTHEACVGFLNTCSVNAAKTACVTAKDTCSLYTATDCGYAVNEGECVVSSGSCV